MQQTTHLSQPNLTRPACRAILAGGVALELIARLCNELGASPWVNVPHLADDDYVRSLAQFFKDQLRPDLKVGLGGLARGLVVCKAGAPLRGRGL